MVDDCILGFKYCINSCPYCKEKLCDYPYIGSDKSLSINGGVLMKLVVEDIIRDMENAPKS